MPLQRFRYRAYLDDSPNVEPWEVEVEVTNGDRLRAELEAGRQNLPVDPRQAPLQTSTLWLWCALVRTGRVDVDYRTFRDGTTADGVVERPPVLVMFEQIRDEETGEPAVTDVPPTVAPSDLPSPSQATSATSDGGSIPTPTNA